MLDPDRWLDLHRGCGATDHGRALAIYLGLISARESSRVAVGDSIACAFRVIALEANPERVEQAV